MSRGPSGLPRNGKSRNEGEADATTAPQRPENSAEPGPERLATQWHERETKAKRMRPLGFNDQRSPLSRGPSGLPLSGKSGKNRRSTSVETTGHLSVRARLVPGSDQNRLVDIEPTVEELARLRRKATVRKVIVILVVVAMIAALLVPVIVRVVRVPPEPEGILAAHTPIASRRISL